MFADTPEYPQAVILGTVETRTCHMMRFAFKFVYHKSKDLAWLIISGIASEARTMANQIVFTKIGHLFSSFNLKTYNIQ